MSEEKSNKKKTTSNETIAVYGSLRKGMYNYEYFKSGMQYQKSIEIEGFDMYSLRSYPYIVRGKGNIIVDIMEVTPEFKRRIDGMEHGAGYQSETINVDDQEVTIYTFSKVLSNTEQVPHGDWVKHKKSEKY